MTHLLLNVGFGSMFMLILKWVQVRSREDIIAIGAINYIVALILISPEFAAAVSDPSSPGFAADAGARWGATWGIVLGLCYFIAFFFVIRSIRHVGASRTAVIGALAILVPIVCGIGIWGERPNEWQIAGIGLAVISLVLIGKRGQDRGQARTWWMPLVLLAFFALAGLARLAQEAFKHTSDLGDRPIFLWAAFFCAAIPSVVILCGRLRWPRWREWLFGGLLGVANILQTHFMLKALQALPGFVVFPVSSAGALLLTTLVATLVFGEQIGRPAAWGIAVATVALVLLNWSA